MLIIAGDRQCVHKAHITPLIRTAGEFPALQRDLVDWYELTTSACMYAWNLEMTETEALKRISGRDCT